MQKQLIRFDENERIAHVLMLKSFFLSDIGIFGGQTGVALAMSKFYEHKKNEIFSDFVFDLLELVISKTSKGLPFSFSNVLSGIGWGIEYLIQHKLVEGESVEICEEIDHKIMETDPRRIADYSLETGLEGLLHYVVYHLQGAMKQKSRLPFDNTYLSDIYSVCKTVKSKNMSETLKQLSDNFILFA